MLCPHCQKENRNIARFCKWCGKPTNENQNPLDRLVGTEEVKEHFERLVSTLTHLAEGGQVSGRIHLNLNTILIGETGTGKTFIPSALTEYLASKGILERAKLKIVDAVDYNRFVEHWDSNIKEARGGILFFDNVQKLLPGSYSDNVNPLDKLFIEMDRWEGDPIVILAGLPGGFENFLEQNPAVKSRFKYHFRLNGFSAEELYEICLRTLKDRYAIQTISPQASDKLIRQFRHELKKHDGSFSHGHYARGKAEDMFTAYLAREPKVIGEITDADVRGYVPPVRTIEEILGDLDEFIGMPDVKQAVREIALEVKTDMDRANRGLGKHEKQPIHIVLTGNPGTGKTSIVRKLGEVFEAIGYLDSGHVVEVDRSQMVSQYIGETPKLVDALCDKAMGGILFVDEAYTLAPTNEAGTRDEQGKQALEKLMKRMEDDRGHFVVVAAGYQTEMENLFRINPGIRSRFTRFIHIKDYTPDELFSILMGFVHKKGYNFTPKADSLAKQLITSIYENRDKHFANAREMRLLFEKICTRQAERISHLMPEEQTNETLQTVTEADIPYEAPKPVDADSLLAPLDALVGLEGVKQELRTLALLINLHIKRGESKPLSSQHYVFTGNPGTGKTTVARIMADMLKSLGVISRGQLVEADRSMLVAGYAGQTAIKTNQLIDSALGGVLFIDEAYTLVSGENDNFGKEAIDTLLKRLEDDRGKFVCIVCGYTEQMHHFIDSNPGLKSRFTKNIHFEDYRPAELTKIFCDMAHAGNFTLDEETMQTLHNHFEELYARRDRNFGNAREARKLFDQTVANQSKRLMEVMMQPGFTREMMFFLTSEDILGKQAAKEKTLDEVMTELDEFVGMNVIKEAVRRLAVQVVFLKQRQQMGLGNAEPTTFNLILTGNPGTGKTTVARKLGEVFKAIGVLPTNQVIETDRSQMVGKYVGETPKLVNALCDRAIGGILFIDEAYTLYESENGGDKFGKEAIETLMKRMEDDKGKFVVIAAGYQREMETFLKANPGLESRFNQRLNIEDYSEHELLQIFHLMAKKKQYTVSEDAELALIEKIHTLYEHKTRNFGNAREIRKIFEQTIGKLSMRVASMQPETLKREDYLLIRAEDVP